MHTVFSGDHGLKAIVDPYSSRLLCGQFLGSPTFPRHVGHIIGLRPQPQVSPIAARRIITAMQYVTTVGDRAISLFPGNPVNAFYAPWFTHSYKAIPILISRALEFQTAVEAGKQALAQAFKNGNQFGTIVLK